MFLARLIMRKEGLPPINNGLKPFPVEPGYRPSKTYVRWIDWLCFIFSSHMRSVKQARLAWDLSLVWINTDGKRSQVNVTKNLQDCLKTGKTVELKSPQLSRHWTKLFLLFQSIQQSDYSVIVVINPFVSLSEWKALLRIWMEKNLMKVKYLTCCFNTLFLRL